MSRGGAGGRGQHEHIRKTVLRRLPAERDRRRRPAIEKARGLLAGEGDRLRPDPQHLVPERRNVDRKSQRLMIHARARLAEIGEADPELQQRRKLARLKAARRDADLVNRAPEPVAGMRVIVAKVCRPLAGGGADEDEAQAGLELVGEFFQRGRAFRESRGSRMWPA